jgi:hypothetical protein
MEAATARSKRMHASRKVARSRGERIWPPDASACWPCFSSGTNAVGEGQDCDEAPALSLRCGLGVGCERSGPPSARGRKCRAAREELPSRLVVRRFGLHQLEGRRLRRRPGWPAPSEAAADAGPRPSAAVRLARPPALSLASFRPLASTLAGSSLSAAVRRLPGWPPGDRPGRAAPGQPGTRVGDGICDEASRRRSRPPARAAAEAVSAFTHHHNPHQGRGRRAPREGRSTGSLGLGPAGAPRSSDPAVRPAPGDPERAALRLASARHRRRAARPCRAEVGERARDRWPGAGRRSQQRRSAAMQSRPRSGCTLGPGPWRGAFSTIWDQPSARVRGRCRRAPTGGFPLHSSFETAPPCIETRRRKGLRPDTSSLNTQPRRERTSERRVGLLARAPAPGDIVVRRALSVPVLVACRCQLMPRQPGNP